VTTAQSTQSSNVKQSIEMPVPLGFGVGEYLSVLTCQTAGLRIAPIEGDFIAVSKLMYQIGAELKRNPESKADYQGLVVELQALDRAMKQPQSIQPARNDLNRFRALAITCHSPLQAFFG
jgi:hypothetical protein